MAQLLKGQDREDFQTYFGDARDIIVGDWYRQEYPTDDLGAYVNREIRFGQLYILMKYGVPFYELIGVGDSIVRERIFGALSEVYGVPYENIYKMWLNS